MNPGFYSAIKGGPSWPPFSFPSRRKNYWQSCRRPSALWRVCGAHKRGRQLRRPSSSTSGGPLAPGLPPALSNRPRGPTTQRRQTLLARCPHSYGILPLSCGTSQSRLCAQRGIRSAASGRVNLATDSFGWPFHPAGPSAATGPARCLAVAFLPPCEVLQPPG